MKKFKPMQSNQPFLSPLGTQRGVVTRMRQLQQRLPDSAAPIAFMVVGAVAVVALLATLLSGTAHLPPAPDAMAQGLTAPPERTALEITTAGATPPATAAPVRPPDPEPTASILATMRDNSAFLPEVDIAETEEEIAALEARQQIEVDQGGLASTPSVESATAIPFSGEHNAVTTNYVNMRAAAGDEAEVLEVVPALAEIEAEEDCDWCAVTYDGRTGYIYKSFISYR